MTTTTTNPNAYQSDFIDRTDRGIATNPAFGYVVTMLDETGDSVSEMTFVRRTRAIEFATALAAEFPVRVRAVAVVGYTGAAPCLIAVRGDRRTLVAAGLIDDAGRFRSI